MKYEVTIEKMIMKTITVEADTPQQAARLTPEGYRSVSIDEIRDDEPCAGFAVYGHCEACSVALLSEDDLFSDAEGVLFCKEHYDEMVAAEPDAVT